MCKKSKKPERPERIDKSGKTSSPSDTFDYWDADRMEEAKPLSLDREETKEQEDDGKRSRRKPE